MRALREALGEADTDARWEAFLLEAIRRAPLPDFLLYGEPYLALNGVVLGRGEHRRLVALTDRFATIFQKAVAALARDTAALERMGFPWVAIELLGREPLDAPFVLGRFDFMLDHQGRWQLLEYNADTPSGAREGIAVEPLIARALGVSFGSASRLLASRMRRSFVAAMRAAGLGDGTVLGLVTDTGYAEDLAQTVFATRLLGPALRRRGTRVVYGDVDNLSHGRGRLRLLGQPLDALYRYYPYETLLGRQAFVDLFGAVASGRLLLVNGLRGLLAQNKGVLAWLWEHRDDSSRFTAAERQALRQHLPAVRWIDAVAADEDPSQVVLKQVFGREGEEVYFGDRISAEDWARCRAWGSYVVQQRVRTAPVAAAIRTSRGPVVRDLWPAVGSFTAGGRWAGYYTRLDEPITTAHAKFVATFFESAAPSAGAAGRPATSPTIT